MAIQFVESFDPLDSKFKGTTEVVAIALKKEIKNILGSYVGWFDPFSELIQNALDSIEERAKTNENGYVPTIWITIDIQQNLLVVTDNGVGLDEQKYTQFLAPNFSFKSGNTRGHKGVGATYLAYGFNYIQISTKTKDFTAVGKMQNARNWLTDENPAGNPQVQNDTDGPVDSTFNDIDQGVSICVKFDTSTNPKDLKWIVADTAESWLQILSVKTGLGSFIPNPKIRVNLRVIDKNNKKTEVSADGIEYLWPNKVVEKSETFTNITKKATELFTKKGADFSMPSSMTKLDMFYDTFNTESLKSLIDLVPEELEICDKFNPEVYFGYAYSLKIWQNFNESLKIRSNMKILYGGIQIAANNMAQGELIQIPLNRNIGRQNQVHIVFHFSNCSADLGRKGFQNEIVDFSKDISKKLIDGPLQKFKKYLRPITGAARDLVRKKEVDDWQKEMIEHEKSKPLNLINENFFLPLKTVSITSEPSREQDVIALFNQLLAGGVIRGIRILSTNERLTYDGLYRIIIDEPIENHIYDSTINPLGIKRDVIAEIRSYPFITEPTVLEYKFSLDALIENIEDGTKNSNDIGLVVVWETGEDYKGNYKITSLLDTSNLTQRQYHGVTHLMTNVTTGQREMDLIVLKELIDYLNNPDATEKIQIAKYDEE
jgi:DNA-binding Lrp family transcriptional regulator